MTGLDAARILDRVAVLMLTRLPSGIEPSYFEAFVERHRAELLERLCARLPAVGFRVVGQRMWLVHWGGANNIHGGLEGQLTALDVDGVGRCYVRENLAADHFYVSSDQRMGWKQGRKPKGDVLEVAAPPGAWAAVAEAVRRADALGRRVRANRRFTMAWAEREMAGSAGEAG